MARIGRGGGATGATGVQVRVPWSDKRAWSGVLDKVDTTAMATRLLGVVASILYVVPFIPMGGYEKHAGTLAVALAVAANGRSVMASAGPVQWTS